MSSDSQVTDLTACEGGHFASPGEAGAGGSDVVRPAAEGGSRDVRLRPASLPRDVAVEPCDSRLLFRRITGK
ncbi:Hypothetical predicted protein [Podarcis lilfordi]|uniref:Uncharacterized protein n=1 Tax=Podarcis lilfordi TaxID=74358 RepID=A0AA35PC05_9SAUR|nr:Hypothetical predicted protein [Podarcis lilfordi]